MRLGDEPTKGAYREHPFTFRDSLIDQVVRTQRYHLYSTHNSCYRSISGSYNPFAKTLFSYYKETGEIQKRQVYSQDLQRHSEGPTDDPKVMNEFTVPKIKRRQNPFP